MRGFLSVNSLNYGYFPNLVRNRTKFSNNFDTFISSLELIRNLKKRTIKTEPANKTFFHKFRTETIK